MSLEICVINVDLLPNLQEDDPVPDHPVLTSAPLGGQVTTFLQADVFEGPVTFLPEITDYHMMFVPLHDGAERAQRHVDGGWSEITSVRPLVHLQSSEERVGWSWGVGARVLRLQVEKAGLQRFISGELRLIGVESRILGERDLDDSEICHNASRIADVLADERPGQAVLFDAAARTLVVHMVRTYLVTPGVASQGALSGDQFAEIVEYIDERIAEPIRVHDLAERANMSESAFLRAIKAATGETPHELVRRRRLECVCRLLREDILSLGQIASTAGFADQAHLSRVFKRAYGHSPSQWRRVEAEKNQTKRFGSKIG